MAHKNDERQKRLSAALRTNLRRRKEQAREIGSTAAPAAQAHDKPGA